MLKITTHQLQTAVHCSPVTYVATHQHSLERTLWPCSPPLSVLRSPKHSTGYKNFPWEWWKKTDYWGLLAYIINNGCWNRFIVLSVDYFNLRPNFYFEMHCWCLVPLSIKVTVNGIWPFTCWLLTDFQSTYFFNVCYNILMTIETFNCN